MGRDTEQGGRRSASEVVASERASREQTRIDDLRGQVLGRESVGNRQISADEANELRRGAQREGLEAAAVMDFTRSLADLADEQDDGPAEEEEREQHEGREHALAEEIDADPDDADEENEKQRQKGKRGRNHLATEKKTSGMGGGDGPAVPSDSTSPPPSSPRRADTVDGLPVVSVVPRKRRNAIELDAILLAGKKSGVLPPWMRHRADAFLQAMTTRDFTRLFHALNIAGSRPGAAFVLKAGLAHRPSVVFVPFAEILASVERADVLGATPGADAPDEPPAEATLAEIRLFWDPIALLGIDEYWNHCLHEEADGPDWSVPRWLRGVPRPALDGCLVGVDLALQGALDAEEDTTRGAGDALSRVFAAEGSTHPSLKRWTNSLLVRAEDRDGLLSARAALQEARASMAVPWKAPADGKVWR